MPAWSRTRSRPGHRQQRAGLSLSVQEFGTYSARSINACPRAPCRSKYTATWAFSIRLAVPVYCRCTPTLHALHITGLIQDQDRLLVTGMVHHVPGEIITDRVGVPRRPADKCCNPSSVAHPPAIPGSSTQQRSGSAAEGTRSAAPRIGPNAAPPVKAAAQTVMALRRCCASGNTVPIKDRVDGVQVA